MIFAAQRAADVLNVFVGLYLVPKYVDPAELGAVVPLTQFAAFLAAPAAVFATTFRQELTSLALSGAFGRLKTLLRSVFLATAVFFVLAIVISRFVLPLFLTKIRIVEGSLGFMILVASFIATVAPVYSNALQSLKKFPAISLIGILGAPVRLVTMILAMPFRAITGYFTGQAATPLFTIVSSVLALRRELAVKAEPYWTRPIVVRFARLFAIFGLSAIVVSLTSLVEATVLRERLPAADSAAYYLITRFSEFSTILAGTLMLTVYPYAAEISAGGRDVKPIVLKCMGASALFGGALALLFLPLGGCVLSLIPNAAPYVASAWAIPTMIVVMTLSQCSSFYTTAEIAAGRFRFMWWTLPLHALYAVILLLAPNITSLGMMIAYMAGFQIVRLACTFVALFKR